MALPSDASRPAGLRRDVHDTRTPLLAHRVAQLNSSLLSVRANASSISSASSSSRQPLSATFGTLSTADIAFFDAVITHLHSGGASDFASLKKAYNAVRALPVPSPCNEEKDAFLWDKTLCLLQVRGRDWSSRWDAVRMALGLEPRSTSSGEDATLRSEDASESSEEDVTTGGSADELERWRLQAAHTNIHRNPGHRHAVRLPDALQQQSQPSKLQSLAAQARTLSRQAGRFQDGDDGNRPHGQDKGAYVDTASDSSTLAPSATYAMSERQKAIAAQQSVPHKLRQYSGTPPNGSESDSPDLQRPTRAMQPSKEGLTGVKPLSRPHPQPSDTDRSTSCGPEARRDTSARTSAQNEVQRRFAAVIARSREERAALAAAEAERVALAEELSHAPATRLAEEHDRRKILRPALGWWRQRYQRLEANAGRVDRAHDQIILSKALRCWVKRRQAKEQALNAAGGVDKVRCLLGAWRVWRKTCALRKEHRKEARVAELKSAWDAVTSERDHRAKWRAWEEWRSRFLHRFAGRLREEHLVRGAYSMWNLALARSRRLKSVENEMAQTMMRNRLADSFDSWQKRLALRRAEAEASQRLDDRLVRSAFEAWRKQGELNVLATNYLALRVKRGAFKAWQTATSERADRARRESLADRWRVRRKKRQAISRWQNKYQKLADMQDTASSLLVIREERLQHRVLTQWMLEERLVLVCRVRSSRTVAAAFKAWKDRKSHFAALLEPKAEQVQARSRRATTTNVWSKWRRRHSLHEADAAEADAFFAKRLLSKSLAQWSSLLESQRQMQRRAAKVAEFVALRRSWQEWAALLRERRCAELQSRRATIGVRAAFTTWRACAAERAKERVAVEKVTNRRDDRMLRLALGQWMNRVIEQRSQALRASERWDSMMLRGAWSQWVAACVRHEDLINLGQSFADVKKEERTRRILSSWLSRTRINRGHRVAAEAFKAKRDRRKMEEAWVLWTEKHYDISLRPLEYEVAMKRQEGAANAVMRKWQARTRVLPALKLDRQRLLSHSWDKWSDNLPVAVARRQAIDRDRNQMLGKAFFHWIRASKAKRSMRAAARFGGPSAVRLRAAAQLRKVSPFVHRPSSSPGASPVPTDSTKECKPEVNGAPTPKAHRPNIKPAQFSESILSATATQSPSARRAPEVTLAQLAASPLRRLRSANAVIEGERRSSLDRPTDTLSRLRQQAVAAPSGVATQVRGRANTQAAGDRTRPVSPTARPPPSRMPTEASSALRRWAHGVAASADVGVLGQDTIDFSEAESDATERRPIAQSITSPSSTSALLETTSARRQDARRQASPAPSRAQSAMDHRTAASRRANRKAEAEREARKQEDVLQLLRARRRQRALQPEGATDNED